MANVNHRDVRDVEELLSKVGKIIEKYDNRARETGESFNIFEIMQKEYDEVIVCRVLAALLDPKGQHGQGGAYLETFLRDCLGEEFSKDAIENVKVFTEKNIDSGRRIDLVVEVDDRFIPIEVKIEAQALDRQCYDYCMYARKKDKKAKIVYLTLFGDMPPKNSKRGLKEDDIVLISFGKHILEWLEKCLDMTDKIAKNPVCEILRQFILAIKKITNQMEDKPMNEITELLRNSEQNMRHAKCVFGAYENCRKEIIKEFFDAFHKKFRKVMPDLEKKETNYSYYKNAPSKITIDYFIGFLNPKEQNGFLAFCLCQDNNDDLIVGFYWIKDGKQMGTCDKIYENSQTKWFFKYTHISFNDENINLKKDDDNYFKLFDSDLFDEIVDSAVEQAQAMLANADELIKRLTN